MGVCAVRGAACVTLCIRNAHPFPINLNFKAVFRPSVFADPLSLSLLASPLYLLQPTPERYKGKQFAAPYQPSGKGRDAMIDKSLVLAMRVSVSGTSGPRGE